MSAPAQVKLPPQDLRFTTAGRMACSPFQLVASTSLRSKKVNRCPTLAEMLEQPDVAGMRDHRGQQVVDPAAQIRQAGGDRSGVHLTCVPGRPEGQGVLEDALQRLGYLGVGTAGILDHAHAAPEKVGGTHLVRRFDELAVGSPAVALDDLVEARPEHRRRLREAPPLGNQVNDEAHDGAVVQDALAHEGPQPRRVPTHPPAGLIGGDHLGPAHRRHQRLVVGVAARAAREIACATAPGVMARPKWANSRQILRSERPISFFRSTARAVALAPIIQAAAPAAVEVWSGWRPRTTLPQRRQRPLWMRISRVRAATGGMSATHCSIIPSSSTSPPQSQWAGQGHLHRLVDVVGNPAVGFRPVALPSPATRPLGVGDVDPFGVGGQPGAWLPAAAPQAWTQARSPGSSGGRPPGPVGGTRLRAGDSPASARRCRCPGRCSRPPAPGPGGGLPHPPIQVTRITRVYFCVKDQGGVGSQEASPGLPTWSTSGHRQDAKPLPNMYSRAFLPPQFAA